MTLSVTFPGGRPSVKCHFALATPPPPRPQLLRGAIHRIQPHCAAGHLPSPGCGARGAGHPPPRTKTLGPPPPPTPPRLTRAGARSLPGAHPPACRPWGRVATKTPGCGQGGGGGCLGGECVGGGAKVHRRHRPRLRPPGRGRPPPPGLSAVAHPRRRGRWGACAWSGDLCAPPLHRPPGGCGNPRARARHGGPCCSCRTATCSGPKPAALAPLAARRVAAVQGGAGGEAGARIVCQRPPPHPWR